MTSENDLKLTDQIRRADAAKEITEHPLFVEAITAIKADLYDKFTRTEAGEKGSQQRDELWRKQQSIDWLEKYLKEVITTGRLAHETLLQKAKRKLKLA